MQTPEAHLFEQVAESLRLQIARGELRPGDRLPSIRQTAQLWQCTPGTVSRAYAILAEEGLVNSRRGGGTRVSQNPFTEEQAALKSAVLVNQSEGWLLNLLGQGYAVEEVQSAFQEALARWHTLQAQALAQAAGEHGEVLRFVGSNDLTIDYLARKLNEGGAGKMSVSFQGSLGGLMALARGEADIAGSHLWDEKNNVFNEPYVRRVLPGKRVALVTVVGRTFGLMLPPGNPQQIKELGDLALADVRWVNRQPGSGTRVWLDAQLRALGIDAQAIDGFETIKTTHIEVAQAIEQGSATAGLGIYAAALAHGLDFIPLAEEQYQLVIPGKAMETAACRALLEALAADEFKQTVAGFGGYTTNESGTIEWIE